MNDLSQPSQPTLPIRRIVQGKNPRTYFDPDKMAELEEGIRAVGVGGSTPSPEPEPSGLTPTQVITRIGIVASLGAAAGWLAHRLLRRRPSA